MTQRRKSKKTEAEPRRVNRRTFLAGAGAAACVGAGLWLRRKKFSKRDKTKAEKQPVKNPALPAGEWRAVWVSYLEWTAMDFSSADSFRAGCVQMLENCAGLGLNTVLAQVRPFGDSLYKSQLFPWSHLCTGVQGQDPGFDPLDILLQEAHGRGLSVEAWLNPYRLRSSAAMPPNLAENNLANTHPEWVCAVGDGTRLSRKPQTMWCRAWPSFCRTTRWTASTLTIIFTLRPKKASMRRSLRPAVRQTLQHGGGRT